MSTDKELKARVQSVANELKALYNADYTEEQRDELREIGEPCCLYEYFTDVLDFEYAISSKKDFLGVKVWVTLGGPNIWIDTRDGEVKGAWGRDRESAWLPREVCDEIDSIFEELYYI